MCARPMTSRSGDLHREGTPAPVTDGGAEPTAPGADTQRAPDQWSDALGLPQPEPRAEPGIRGKGVPFLGEHPGCGRSAMCARPMTSRSGDLHRQRTPAPVTDGRAEPTGHDGAALGAPAVGGHPVRQDRVPVALDEHVPARRACLLYTSP